MSIQAMPIDTMPAAVTPMILEGPPIPSLAVLRKIARGVTTSTSTTAKRNQMKKVVCEIDKGPRVTCER
eukprot:7381130-Prymnesium_polylepis.2